MKVCMLM